VVETAGGVDGVPALAEEKTSTVDKAMPMMEKFPWASSRLSSRARMKNWNTFPTGNAFPMQ
jgi:hypothetical protein